MEEGLWTGVSNTGKEKTWKAKKDEEECKVDDKKEDTYTHNIWHVAVFAQKPHCEMKMETLATSTPGEVKG